MNVVFGKEDDIDSWLSLVREVRGNFPGLETEAAIEEHKRTVLEFMSERRALCVKSGEEIIGVLLFSKTHNMICCLAVSPAHRRKGIAAALMSKALDELDRTRDITVTTFRDNDPRSAAPRALYKKFGFTEGELVVEFGCPSQVFVLSGDKL
ncbi:MAG: GNAT family N-acetyltransferase [Oscillospiraceae bacterium]|nr:GNAT family N-acetyltransferase [Oscillospiraceae bacterium]